MVICTAAVDIPAISLAMEYKKSNSVGFLKKQMILSMTDHTETNNKSLRSNLNYFRN